MDNQEFPEYRYHLNGNKALIRNAQEEAALGGGWSDNPREIDLYKGPRSQDPDQYDPVKWVDEWPVSGLSEGERKKIKAGLYKAHAGFWRSPDASNAVAEAMGLAFGVIAQTLFDAGLLDEQRLREDVASLVWDSAVAGGWFRLASENRKRMFPEPLGHYWGWTGNDRDCKTRLSAETADWRGKLLSASEPTSRPAKPPKAQARSTVTSGAHAEKWKDVKISFISDERVRILVAGQPQTFNYDEMGFGDRRSGKSNRAWAVLRLLAQTKGVLGTTNRGSKNWAPLEQQISRTRKLLKRHFGLSEDPLPFEKAVGYQARFQIEAAPSSNT
jgi:hypothetical protein